MNDFLVDEIYKNTQRLRNKNRLEEKSLHLAINGHKGINQKMQ